MRTFTIVMALLAAASAHAVTFRRDVLTIQPKPPEIVLNEQGQPAKEQPEPRKPIQFYTDLRDEQALQLDWVHSAARITEERTMTILFDPPRYDQIRRQNVYQPLDVLSISEQGRIVQIAKSIVLAELNAPIETSMRVRARLILKGGAAEQLELQPGDMVQHPAFVPAPKVEVE